MKLFPIGTSRLHEPLSLISDQVNFPGVGYFHSSSQILSWLKILVGESQISLEQSRFYFRKDQTPDNPFNINLWGESYLDAIEFAREKFNQSSVLIIEISTEKSWLMNGLPLQGNPNFEHNISYGQAWKEGYYNLFYPQIPIRNIDDDSFLEANLREISKICREYKKKVILMGHLVDPNNPNQQRLKLNKQIEEIVNNIGLSDFLYYDQMNIVGEFGFRELDGGIVDIHHLPWEAFNVLVDQILTLTNSMTGSDYTINKVDSLVARGNLQAAEMLILSTNNYTNDVNLYVKYINVLFESYKLVPLLKACNQFFEFNLRSEKVDKILIFLKDNKLTNSKIINDLNLTKIPSKYVNNIVKTYLPSHIIKSKILEIGVSNHQERAEFFLNHYNWLKPLEKDVQLFSNLFISSAWYNPYIYNLLNIHVFEQTKKYCLIDYVKCLFRLKRHNDIFLTLNMFEGESHLNELTFFKNLALQNLNIDDISFVDKYSFFESPLSREEEFSNLFFLRSLALSINMPLKVNTNFKQLIDSIINVKKIESKNKINKIAVCFSGQLRGAQHEVPKWIKFFEELNIDVDIFVSTWDTNPIQPINRNNISRSFSSKQLDSLTGFCEDDLDKIISMLSISEEVDSDDIKQLFKPKKYSIENEESFNDLLDLLSVFEKNPRNQLKMFYQINKVFNLAKEYEKSEGFEYDGFIRIRPDLKFSMLDIDEIKNVCLNRAIGVYFFQVDGIDDKFAICSRSAMFAYSAIWDLFYLTKKIKILPLRNIYLSESLLLRIMFAYGVKVQALEKTKFGGLRNNSYSDKALSDCINGFLKGLN